MQIGAQDIAARFALGGEVTSVVRHGSGHIHQTHEVEVRTGEGATRRFILQRIHRGVFPDPEAVIRNAERVIEHLRQRVREEGGDPDREVPALVRSTAGRGFVRDAQGALWRCYVRIEGATAHATAVGEPARVQSIAEAFGRFLQRMDDVPPNRMEEVLPRFHDGVGVLRTFREAAHRDSCGRARDLAAERRFVEERAALTSMWAGVSASGRIRRRIVHNDTKLDNVLIDDATGRGLCVIDLDTVMGGFAVVDMADCARSALTGPEDVGGAFDLRQFRAVVEGFAKGMGETLPAIDLDLVVAATRAIALELGTRILTDHLLGDRWFAVSYPEQNLKRARVQFELVGAIEQHAVEMEDLVRRIR